MLPFIKQDMLPAKQTNYRFKDEISIFFSIKISNRPILLRFCLNKDQS